MCNRIELPAEKALVFHFSGGPDTGYSLRFNRPHTPHGAASLLWAKSRMGTPGQRFNWFQGQETHAYVVTDKRETTEAIIVICEHVADVDPASSSA
jgi:hypothetical protein